MSDCALELKRIREELEKPVRVLIVEDSEDDAQLAMDVLDSLRVWSVAVPSVAKAKDIVRGVDLILLDLRLVSGDGDLLLEWMVAEKIHTPVAVVTGFVDDDTYKRLSRFTVATILQKPVTPENMTLLLKHLNLWREA